MTCAQTSENYCDYDTAMTVYDEIRSSFSERDSYFASNRINGCRRMDHLASSTGSVSLANQSVARLCQLWTCRGSLYRSFRSYDDNSCSSTCRVCDLRLVAPIKHLRKYRRNVEKVAGARGRATLLPIFAGKTGSCKPVERYVRFLAFGRGYCDTFFAGFRRDNAGFLHGR